MRARQQIELKEGVMVELLFTPSMYERGRERGVIITIEDKDNPIQVVEAYTKLLYLGAINAWEALRFDNLDMGDFPYGLIDFQLWTSENPRKFSRLIADIFQCITGKTMEQAQEEVTQQDNLKKK